ncbi:hypothetical protein Tco_1409489 [Tanacetum coccineum]
MAKRDNFILGGGDDEGSVAANSVMPALADGDRGVCLLGQVHSRYNKKVRLELDAPPPPRPPHPAQHHHHRCHHQMTHYHRLFSVSWMVRHQQIEADPSLVPLAPHQKLTGISMARN